MKLFERIGNACFALAGKSLSPEMAGWVRGDDIDANEGGAKLTLPYAQSSSVYIAISCLAENVAQIPLRISKIPQSAKQKLSRGASASFKKRVLGENIIESGDAVDLFNNPHPTMDRALFMSNVVSWKALRGEFFVVPLDASDAPVDLASRSGRVKAMLALEPGLFWHNVQGYDLVSWRYTGSPLMSPLPSEMLLPTEVIHHRTFNPYLYWRGLSPLLLATLAAMTDYAASQFMKGLMTNNADTGVIVTTDQQASVEQREALNAALRERKRKAGTADRPLFLWGGMKLEKPALSSADMEFLANRKYNREEIFAVFKVPPSMAGIETASGGKAGGSSGSSSGGSQQQDRRVFVENTITNFCRSLEAAFTPIVKRFDPSFELWFDIDSLPIMQEARRDRLDAAGKAFGLGVPLNDINTVYDLGFRKFPHGDTAYLPFNLQPVENSGEIGKPTGDDPNAPDNPEESPEDQEKSNPLVRAQKLFASLLAPKLLIAPPPRTHVCNAPQGFESSIAGSVKQKKGKLQKFFFEQRGRVLAKLNQIEKSSWSNPVFLSNSKALDDIWNSSNEDGELLKKLKPLLIWDLDFGGAQVWQEISQAGDFNLPPNDAIAFFDKRKKVLTDINDTTWNSLKASLQEGLSAGESYDQLADRVKAIMQTAGDSRAQMIALTETNVAVNSGRDLAMVQAGVERKGWLTSHLENTRPTHLANEDFSNENNGIPIDDTWPNGCDYPGDPDGEPGETINCRCVGYAMAGEKSVKAAKFLRFEEWVAAKIQHGHNTRKESEVQQK